MTTLRAKSLLNLRSNSWITNHKVSIAEGRIPKLRSHGNTMLKKSERFITDEEISHVCNIYCDEQSSCNLLQTGPYKRKNNSEGSSIWLHMFISVYTLVQYSHVCFFVMHAVVKCCTDHTQVPVDKILNQYTYMYWNATDNKSNIIPKYLVGPHL